MPTEVFSMSEATGAVLAQETAIRANTMIGVKMLVKRCQPGKANKKRGSRMGSTSRTLTGMASVEMGWACCDSEFMNVKFLAIGVGSAV